MTSGTYASRGRASADTASEGGRIALLLERDGPAATVAWVRRTAQIYRRAVLRRDGYGREYRRVLIASYCEFKRWLRHPPAQCEPCPPHSAPHDRAS